MKWIFRSFVVTLLAGSIVLNGLQYVGSSFLTGVHSLIEGLTGIPSAMTTHAKTQSKLDKQRISKIKAVRQRANGRLARLVGRSGTRLGADLIPILPIALAIETGLIAYDFLDYCEAIEDIDEMSKLLGVNEVEPKPGYCGLDMNDLKSVLKLSDEYSEAKTIQNETGVLEKYGEQIHIQIEGWKNILD